MLHTQMYDVVNQALSSKRLISKQLNPKDHRNGPLRSMHEYTLQHFFCVCPKTGLYTLEELNQFGYELLDKITKIDPRIVAPDYFDEFKKENQFLKLGNLDVIEDLKKGVIKTSIKNSQLVQLNPRKEKNLLKIILFPNEIHMQKAVKNGTNMYSIPLIQIPEYKEEKIFAIK